jgi:hypothetical protein
MRTAALPLVAASLIGSASLPERASAQDALDRLFLDTSNYTPLNEVLSFNSETAVENFYGENSSEASLAAEFYAGYSGSSAYMLFARYPVGGARARLYGSNISGLTLHRLQEVDGTISITSQGYNFSASVNLSGVKGFYAAAASIQNALDQTLPVEAVTTGSSITPVSLGFTGSVTAGVMTVTSASPGSIQDGGYINGSGIRTGTQVVTQLSGTPGGVGTYSVFYWPSQASVPSEKIKESYGKLTIGSVSSGTVAVGEQVTGAAGVLADSAIQANLSGSGAGSTWVVNLYQSVAAGQLTMTAAPLDVTYNPVTGAGGKTKSGSFWIEQQGNFTYASSSMTYAAPGTTARTLGLTQAIGAYLSSPGEDVTSPSEWMNNIVQENGQFSSFQTTFAPDPGTIASLEAWAQSLGYQYLEDYTTTTPPIVDSEPSAIWTAEAPATAAVPEPSTWAMLLLGLAGLGFVRYRLRPSTCLSGRRLGSKASLPTFIRIGSQGPTV